MQRNRKFHKTTDFSNNIMKQEVFYAGKQGSKLPGNEEKFLKSNNLWSELGYQSATTFFSYKEGYGAVTEKIRQKGHERSDTGRSPFFLNFINKETIDLMPGYRDQIMVSDGKANNNLYRTHPNVRQAIPTEDSESKPVKKSKLRSPDEAALITLRSEQVDLFQSMPSPVKPLQEPNWQSRTQP